jgi:hypothetical protein
MVNNQKQLHSSAPQWPRAHLLRHGPELPMAERVSRYHHNIRTIHAAGCRVPTIAMPDTLDAAQIEAWFIAGAETSAHLCNVIGKLGKLPADSMIPSSFARVGRR